MAQRFTNFWRLMRLSVSVFGLLAIFLFSGMQIQQLLDSGERAALVARFPVVRAEEKNICATNNAERDAAMKDLRAAVQDTRDLAAYTLRFLGDRARVTDDRNAKLLKQTQAATAAAATAAEAAQQAAKQAAKKLSDVAVKAYVAASAAQAVNRKLDTATRPALPAQPWIGKRGQ